MQLDVKVILLHVLPSDLLLRCFKFLGIRELANLACVSSGLKQLAFDSELWRCLFAKAVSCRTNFDVTPHWRMLLRLLETNRYGSKHYAPFRCASPKEKCWMLVSCCNMEVPVAYSSEHNPKQFLQALLALMCPNNRFEKATLRRFDRNVPGDVIAILHQNERSSPCDALNNFISQAPVSFCDSSLNPPPATANLQTHVRGRMAELSLTRVSRAVVCFDEQEPEEERGAVLLYVWQEEEVLAGKPRHVWVRREERLERVKERLWRLLGIAVERQRLFTVRSHHDDTEETKPIAAHRSASSSSASAVADAGAMEEGGGRGGQQGRGGAE
eukprot:CAMPEP_0181316924 /NCGR_PEP_ID=MMETSP1101-20121128/16153_1 /TAXON_ID=46948 /ORGANISM="Rhodomonas abbreviata, Strain Caron Lab Isolate" /LENGTH=327 /DNA_ID=CAMNT_0023424201 /DNA_START=334 /DNA_END=1314 /DNA_ORIENTATION=-